MRIELKIASGLLLGLAGLVAFIGSYHRYWQVLIAALLIGALGSALLIGGLRVAKLASYFLSVFIGLVALSLISLVLRPGSEIDGVRTLLPGLLSGLVLPGVCLWLIHRSTEKDRGCDEAG
jgi:4-amino-4-deoxy-L-arabinose transferase-like glycosyltransferase